MSDCFCLYRFIPLNRLYEMFDCKENTLVSPKKWEDVFENIVFKKSNNKNYNAYDVVFGQCWTRGWYSDALWRIYSPDKNSVRIKTTSKKLLKSVSNASGRPSDTKFALVNVSYVREKELIKEAKKMLLNEDEQYRKVFNSLQFKRNAFRHEKECRLLIWDDTVKRPDGLYKYTIDPHELITQVMFDPRMTKSEYEVMKSDFERKTRFKGKIERSGLYTLPKKFEINL